MVAEIDWSDRFRCRPGNFGPESSPQHLNQDESLLSGIDAAGFCPHHADQKLALEAVARCPGDRFQSRGSVPGIYQQFLCRATHTGEAWGVCAHILSAGEGVFAWHFIGQPDSGPAV